MSPRYFARPNSAQVIPRARFAHAAHFLYLHVYLHLYVYIRIIHISLSISIYIHVEGFMYIYMYMYRGLYGAVMFLRDMHVQVGL